MPGKENKQTHNLLEHYKSAPEAEQRRLNLEIRRNFYDTKGKDLTAGTNERQSNGEDAGLNGTASAESATKTLEDIAKEPKKSINCSSCGIDCTRLRYHFTRSASAATANTVPAKVDYDLCPQCYLSARYGDLSSLDFVKLEDPNYTAVLDRDAPWTDAELLLLLEALEVEDDDWNKVADHVKTRTREECVVKFLQLEIEDKYLESDPYGNVSYGTLDQGRVPFTQADNPVMSVVGFLAGMSEPGIAAAAAGRSVDEMRRSLRNRLENGVGGDPGSKNKDKDAMKTEDSMDIDTAGSPQPHDNNQVAIPDDKRDGTTSLPAVAMAASAARAAALASNEEREMTRLVSSAVNTSLQKLELKLQQFSEMEAVLQAERRELERGRQQLFLNRLAFRKRMGEMQEAFKDASLRGGEEGQRMMQEVASGRGEKFGFQEVQETGTDGVQPLSVGVAGYRNYEM